MSNEALGTKFWVYSNFDNHTISIDFPFSDEITKEIDSYVYLLNGWNYGTGVTPSQYTILNAKLVYITCKLHGFESEPHPNLEGTITLIAALGDNFLEIDISEKETITLRHSSGKGDRYKIIEHSKNILTTELEYELIVIQARWKKDTLSEPSTLIPITLRSKKNSEIIPSSKNEEEVYQFFAKTAEDTFQAIAFVNT